VSGYFRTAIKLFFYNTKGDKKVSFDGTKNCLRTTLLLGSPETFNRQQVLLGSIIAPKEIYALNETKYTDKKLLLARKIFRTAMCLLSISLTDKVSQMVLYNVKTTYLPSWDADKVWAFKLLSLQKFQQDEGAKGRAC
jgi:hypothetical protein